jgi:putative membrane protein
MTRIFYRPLICLAVAGLMTFAAAQQDQGSTGASSSMETGSKLSAGDQRFIKEAAEGGMAEVELGKLAVQKASSDDVKQFGQRMIDDHSKANNNLKQVASALGVRLPQHLSAQDEATKERLSKLSGDQFDKAYVRDMVKDHKADVAAFRTESTTGRDASIKSFATQMLPTLRDHLKNAENIEPKVLQARATMAVKSSQ